MSPSCLMWRTRSSRGRGLELLALVATVVLLCVMALPASAPQCAQLTLQWDASTDPQVVGYQIHHGSSSGEYTEVIDVGGQTSYVFSDLDEDTAHYFATTAYDGSGGESGFSMEVVFNSPVGAAASGNDLQLSWDSVGSADHYVVYRSTTDPCFEPSPSDAIATVSATTYADEGGLGDPSVSHFYVIAGVGASGETVARLRRVGEVEYDLVTTEGTKSNLIAIPLSAEGLTNASDLAASIGVCDLVSMWDNSAQGWISHVPGLAFTDFALGCGCAYMVSVTQPTVWTLVGNVLTSYPAQSLVKVPGSTGSNLISIPSGKTSITMASELVSELNACGGEGGCDLVSKWVGPEQGWVSHVPGLSFTDFPVAPNQPYMVSVTGNVTWTSE